MSSRTSYSKTVSGAESTRMRTLIPAFVTFTLAACGGSEPPPETAQSKAPVEHSAPPEHEAEPSKEQATEGQKSSEKSEAKGEKKSEDSAPEVKRTPKDVLMMPGMLFSFSFNSSDAFQKADKDCSDKAAGDPKIKGECMAKEHDKIEGDGMIFKKDPDGKWIWITLRRSGAKTTVLHKFEFEFGEETAKSITIKPKGKDQGTKKGPAPAKVEIEVNDTDIAINDPKLGRMVYVGKLGAVSESGP